MHGCRAPPPPASARQRLGTPWAAVGRPSCRCPAASRLARHRPTRSPGPPKQGWARPNPLGACVSEWSKRRPLDATGVSKAGWGGGRPPPTHHPRVAPRAVKQRLGNSRRCSCGRVLWPGGGPSRAPRHVYVNAAGVAFFDAHSAAPVAFVCGLVSNCDLACINLFPFPASYFEYNA